MLILGLLLLGATGAFAGLLIAYNSSGGPDYTVTMFSNTLGTLNTLQAFLAGIALTLVFGLSLAMTVGGAGYRRRRRSARLAERREAGRARAERDALAARLGDDEVPAGDPAMAGSDAGSRAADSSAPSSRRHIHMPHVFGH
jgi:hypothetical protein